MNLWAGRLNLVHMLSLGGFVVPVSNIECGLAAAFALLVGAGTSAGQVDGGSASGQAHTSQENPVMAVATEHEHTNRLINATSPYLLQHAHNPVNWYEWGAEAFEKAKREDKPIFLSIGYAACHWCHVMEHESFEQEDVAAVLNAHFVSIKVDREERPDIDAVYMAYTQARTRHGGWPMSVWLTPGGQPFHAGTYFPKQALLATLEQIAHSWDNERERITRAAEGAQDFLTQWSASPSPVEGGIAQAVVDRAATTLARYFDSDTGGIGSGSNKFPPSMAMELMLRVYRRTGDAGLLKPVELTLRHMARGGIYDHIGGGICRYSTDRQWLVPHFEKMLYDQATVSSIYLDAFQVTHNRLYAETARDIFEYVLADLKSPQGAFYSSRDADSGGLEGAYYVWTVDQINALLGDEDAQLFCSYYDVTERGNWFEHRGHAPPGPKNILHVIQPPAKFAKTHGLTPEDFNHRLHAWREKLLIERRKRQPPALDDKVLTSWNGLMIASLAKGARVMGEPKYAAAAARA
ncbi:MAG: thioredoxin domain-containing protein [Phycisphaerae bacterium]